MSVTINGIVCDELVEGLDEGIREGGPYATKRYLCNWADRYTLANGLLGLVSNVAGTSFTITAPLSYPESSNLLAREISIEGVGKPTQGAVQLSFPYAKVTVHYGVPTWSPIPLPQMSFDQPYVYATQEMEFSREFITIPNRGVQLSNSHTLDTDYTLVSPVAVLTINLNRVPFLPALTIVTGMKNHISSTDYLGVDAGYLKFDGARTHQEASTDGTRVCNITYTFSARTIAPWDYAYDPAGPSGSPATAWFQVQDTSGNPLITRSDLSVLIPSAFGG